MTRREIEAMCRNPTEYILSQCVPGMPCGDYGEDDFTSERAMRLREHRGLTPILIGNRHYLLPLAIDRMAREFNTASAATFFLVAAQIHDYLTDRGIPVPPPVLTALRIGDKDIPMQRDKDGKARARYMVSHTEHGKLSNREIARRCGCSEGFVRKRRSEVSAHGTQIEDTIEVRRGDTTYTMRRRKPNTEED